MYAAIDNELGWSDGIITGARNIMLERHAVKRVP